MSPERQEKFFSGIGWLLIVLLLLGLAVALSYFKDSTGLSSNSPDTSHAEVYQPKEYKVFYKAGVFGPTNLHIHANDKVIFQNFDFSPIRIVSQGYPRQPELKELDSKTDVPADGEFAFVFSKVGVFNYYNLYNPDEGGAVIVRP